MYFHPAMRNSLRMMISLSSKIAARWGRTRPRWGGMVGALLLAFCLLFFALPAMGAGTLLSPDAALAAHWIASQQFIDPLSPSCGAIKSGEGPAAYVNGAAYYGVSPYSANLAVLGLLESKAPEAVPVAERWIVWYFAHLNPQSAPDGVPYSHFYRASGDGESTCVKPGDPFLCHYNDATDSAAATFFSMLWAACQDGVSASELNTPARAQQVAKLADVVLRLQQADGLCWARNDYRVKYLEDNSEVFGGLRALADLEQNVFNDSQRSAIYQAVAERVQKGILTQLYDSRARLFRIAKFENNDFPPTGLDKWYPDTQAQLWPVLFGVLTPTDPRALAAAAAVDAHWNGGAKPDWAANPKAVNQGWIEGGHAYAALLMGETNRVRIYLQAVTRYKFQASGKTPEFTAPFSVDDAGWLLRILTRKNDCTIKTQF